MTDIDKIGKGSHCKCLYSLLPNYKFGRTGKNGKIIHRKTHPKLYLKETVSFYRNYHENSDDPMNEY
jgi:hypothetical protein